MLDGFEVRFDSKEVFLLHFQKIVSTHVFDEFVKGPDIGDLRNARIIELDESLVIYEEVTPAGLALELLDFCEQGRLWSRKPYLPGKVSFDKG